ncbi:hypothetical protein V6Z11_A12G117000 [Gossypium hirsutum]
MFTPFRSAIQPPPFHHYNRWMIAGDEIIPFPHSKSCLKRSDFSLENLSQVSISTKKIRPPMAHLKHGYMEEKTLVT